MKILLLAFLLALAGVLFFASAPKSVSLVNDTVSLVNEIFSNIQNELAAEMPGIKKVWENADQRVEETGSRVRAGLKKEFDQLMRNSPTAGNHEPERDGQEEPVGDKAGEHKGTNHSAGGSF